MHVAALRGSLVPIVPAWGLEEKGASVVLGWSNRYLPSPKERVHQATDAKGSEIEVECDPSGPLVAHVFKSTIDPFGKITYFRVLRGAVHPDTHPFNTNRSAEERLAQLGQPMGKRIVPTGEIAAGDIGVATKLAGAPTGDTLCVNAHQGKMRPTESPCPVDGTSVHDKNKGAGDK